MSRLRANLTKPGVIRWSVLPVALFSVLLGSIATFLLLSRVSPWRANGHATSAISETTVAPATSTGPSGDTEHSGASDTVRIQSPTGLLFDLNRAELPEALKRGFQVYTPSKPDPAEKPTRGGWMVAAVFVAFLGVVLILPVMSWNGRPKGFRRLNWVGVTAGAALLACCSFFAAIATTVVSKTETVFDTASGDALLMLTVFFAAMTVGSLVAIFFCKPEVGNISDGT